MKLIDALPEIVATLESALLHVGRGDVVTQMREVELVGWSHDEFSEVTSLRLKPGETPSGEAIGLHDEVGAGVYLDKEGELALIELNGYEPFLARLGANWMAGSP
jgi:hypothetical protein